jgi:hypothetical protein
MKIIGKDGKSYEVKPADGDSYDVWLNGELVAAFVLEEIETRVTLHSRAAGKTNEKVITHVAHEFVDRGGGGMRMA